MSFTTWRSIAPILLACAFNARADIAALQKSAVAAEQAKRAADKALQTVSAEIRKLGDQHRTISRQLAAAKSALKPLEADLKKKQDAVNKAQPPVKPATDAYNAAKTKADAATAAVNAVKATLASLKDAHGKADALAKSAKGKPTEKELADAAAKAAGAVASTEQALKKAAANAVKPAAALTAAKAALDKVNKTLTDAQAALKDVQTKIAKSKADSANLPMQLAQVASQVKTLTPKYQQTRKAADLASAAWLAAQRAVEGELIATNKLVSFSKSVAPIFAKRCLACHNARTAKGRFNMETFASLSKGGESGAAFAAGDADASTLIAMIEDGSMPKDADPLAKEQIATIKRWVATGAKLDAGIGVNDPMIRIMPKPRQPAPPESYRVSMPVTAIAFSADGKQVATSGYHEVLFWNAADGALVRRIDNLAERIYRIAYSPDGKLFAVAAGTPGQLGEVKLFDATSGALKLDLLTTDDSVFAAAFSPDGKRLATGGADRAIRIFDVASGSLLATIEDHADWVMDVAFAPDGNKLVSASRDKTSKVFDMTPPKPLPGVLILPTDEQPAISGESLATFNGHGQPVYSAAFSADGKQAVTAGADKQIRIWAVANAKQARNIGGFGGEVFRIRVTKENEVFSACGDKAVRLHSVANGKLLKSFAGQQDWVYSVSAHADAKRVAAGGFDGRVVIWNVDDAKSVAAFTAAPQAKPASTAGK